MSNDSRFDIPLRAAAHAKIKQHHYYSEAFQRALDARWKETERNPGAFLYDLETDLSKFAAALGMIQKKGGFVSPYPVSSEKSQEHYCRFVAWVHTGILPNSEQAKSMPPPGLHATWGVVFHLVRDSHLKPREAFLVFAVGRPDVFEDVENLRSYAWRTDSYQEAMQLRSKIRQCMPGAPVIIMKKS